MTRSEISFEGCVIVPAFVDDDGFSHTIKPEAIVARIKEMLTVSYKGADVTDCRVTLVMHIHGRADEESR